jgi:hypothetical protein
MATLKISVTGTDAEGRIAASTVTASVPGAGTAVPPAALQPGVPSGALEPQPPDAPVPPGEPPGVQPAAVPEPAAQQAQIAGLGNATGHQTTETASKFVPPKVTQAVRSVTLSRRTGGFR